jgi:hypothetical protein
MAMGDNSPGGGSGTQGANSGGNVGNGQTGGGGGADQFDHRNPQNNYYQPPPPPPPQVMGQMGPIGTDIEQAWVPGAQQAGMIYNQGLPELDPNNYLANTMAGLNGPNPYGQQMGNFDPTNQGIGGFDAFTNGATNPYADQMFDNSSARIRDQINSQFGGHGQGSSTGNMAEQIQQLGDYGAKFYGNIYEGDQNRALDATQGRVNAYQNQNQLGLDALSGASGAHQNQLNSAGSFLPGIQQQIQNQPYNNLSQYSNIVSQLTGSSPQQQQQQGSSGWDKLIGAGLTYAAFTGSDRRLKENIVPVGWYPNDLSMYHFNYIGDRRRYEGVMADEVQEFMPEAVITGPDGYMKVNYSALGIEMREIL